MSVELWQLEGDFNFDANRLSQLSLFSLIQLQNKEQ